MNINATLLVEVIIFTLFVMLTKRYVWPPVLAVIEKRQHEIQKGIDAARENTVLLKQAKTDCDDMITEAKAQCREMLKQAEEMVSQKMHDAQADAQTKVEEIVLQARAQMANEKVKMEQGLAKHTEAYLQMALAKILPEANNAASLDRMIDQALSELSDEQK